MIHRYGSDAALQALITKAESLISAVSAVASNAQTSAAQAISAAAAAQDTANQAISRTLTEIGGTLPVTKGGTGAIDAATARTNLGITPANIGASASGHQHSATDIVSDTIPITRGGTGATSASAALTALGAAKRAYYTCSVATSSWSAISGGGYSKTITVSGILSTDVPVVGVVLSSTVSTAKLQGAAFACINRITTASNSITCYAYNSAPTTAITLQLLVVR